jgi:hypothetical protein
MPVTDNSAILCIAQQLALRQSSSMLVTALIAYLGLRFDSSTSAIDQQATVQMSREILFRIWKNFLLTGSPSRRYRRPC